MKYYLALFLAVCIIKSMNNAEKRTNKALAARISLRMSQGWSLEKIGDRTVWTMFGHLYSIRDGALIVSMAGGKQTFRPSHGEAA